MTKIDKIRKFDDRLNGELSLDVWDRYYSSKKKKKIPAHVDLENDNFEVLKTWSIRDFPLPKNYEKMDAEQAEDYLRRLT